MIHRRLRILPKLTPDARPSARSSVIPYTAVDRLRRIYCRRYDRCLDHAEAQHWESFSCERCPVRDELTVEERRDRAMRIVMVFDSQ